MPACRTFPLPPSKNSSERLTAIWRERGWAARLLLPLAGLFRLIVAVRRAGYRSGWLPAERLSVPVIVIGNIIAGGAGKTPLTLWLAQRLKAAGRRPGIISRGYGRLVDTVCEVGAGGTAAEVGDEPLLLAQRSGCPVFVGADRAAAGKALLGAYPDCDVLLCDDGLQHYRLHRDIEVAVIDRRGFMNGWLLPAGPLREPPDRLSRVDALVCNGLAVAPVSGPPVFSMHLDGERFYRLDDRTLTCSPAELKGLRLHAVAGIGEPQRFFDHLQTLGLTCVAHPFPDHYAYRAADLKFDGDALLTTEKDALKFAGLSALPVWVLPVDACVEPDLARTLLEKLDGSATA